MLKGVFFKFVTPPLNILPIRTYIDESADVESVFLIKLFLKSLGLHSKNASDFRNQYRFNTQLKLLPLSDLCVLVGVNLRTTLPLLNSKIRQISLKNNLPVFCIGHYANFSFFVKHVSTSAVSLLSILEGSHWLNFKLNIKSSAKPTIFVDSGRFLDIKALLKYTNLESGVWSGLNVFSCNPSFYVLSELNLLPQNIHYARKVDRFNGIDYFFNYNGDRGKVVVNNAAFKIYQGHHGDNGAFASNLVLPSTSFIEKNAHYVNM